MISFMGGTTINSMLKMTQMNMKWEERKSNIGKEEKENNSIMQAETRELKRLKEMAEQTMKANYVEGIKSKYKSGGTLTKDELEYLKTNHPELYQDAVETAAEREQYKKELENCRTQEDVDRLNMNKMNGFVSQAKSVSANPNIPLSKKVQILEKIMAKVMGIKTDFNEYVKSGAYDRLPSEQDDENKKKVQRKKPPEIEEEQKTDFTKNAVKEIDSEIEKLSKTEGEAGQGAKAEKAEVPAPEIKAEVKVQLPQANATVSVASVKSAPPAAPKFTAKV